MKIIIAINTCTFVHLLKNRMGDIIFIEFILRMFRKKNSITLFKFTIISKNKKP